MRRVLAGALAGVVLALAAGSAAAQETQEGLKAKYEEKVKESWFADYGWTGDYDKAREEAKKGGKLIVAYFTRSYSP